VHIWLTELDQVPERLNRLWHILSADERARAERFHFNTDRDRFIVAHGALRNIIGGYLEVDPAQLEFKTNSYGKPSLSAEYQTADLRFNFSHSHSLAVYAITQGRELGVDVEYLMDSYAGEQIAERFFSPQEVATLRSLPEHLQKEAFFNCWTRKEAFVKAKGEGLSIPLDQFDVALTPGEPAALLNTKWDLKEASQWTIHNLNAGPGYAAALAVKGVCLELKYRHWPK
jgi:4'-phosphopantetheinyl transferase